MRRLALAALAAALLIAGCGSTTHARLWLTPHKTYTACVSSDCGPWSVTLNWQIPTFPSTTGYWLFLNGTQVGSAASSPFTFYGSDCGATNTLGVEAHNASSGHGPLWTTSYTSPACVTFPLSVSTSGRYLQTAGGQPFMIVGDGPQGMIPNVGAVASNVTTDANVYFTDRQAEGFNTALIDAVSDSYTGGPGCDGSSGCGGGTATTGYGATYDGHNPFTATTGSCGGAGCYDLTTPNSTYWQRVAQVVGIAKSYGFEVWLDPIDTGGWLSTIQANCSGCTATSYTTSKDYKFGQFLGCTSATYSATCSTLGSYNNVIWSNGNDFGSYATNDVPVQAIAEGIANTDPGAIQTVEFNETGTPVTSLTDPCTGPSTCIQSWPSLIGIDGTYVYPTARVYDSSLADYNAMPVGGKTLPVYGLEFYYENEHSASLLLLRQQEYGTLLAGGQMGQFYGEHYTTFFCTSGSTCNGAAPPGGNTWENYVDSASNAPGALQITNLTSLFSGREWYNLVPDQIAHGAGSLVTAGYGTDGSATYVTSARTPDGKLGLAYDSGQTTITVSLAGFAGPVTARWYDPTNGSFTAVTGSPFTNSGTQNFTPGAASGTTPVNNAAGDPDWVLVLQA